MSLPQTQIEAPPTSTPAPEEMHLGFCSWVASLVHEHRERLLGYARRRGLSSEDALDAVQDSFLSFLRLPEARAIANVPDDSLKLLTVVLRHNLQNRLRTGWRRRRADALLEAAAIDIDTPTSEQLVTAAEELARVHGCILQLTELTKRVVMLSLLDGEDHPRIAARLGISVGYVRVLLHRARMHVRQCPERAHPGREEA